jgi:hypothetical protein
LNGLRWTVCVNDCNVHDHSLRRARLGDVIGSAVQEIVAMFRDAVSHAPWAAIAILVLLVVVAVVVRNRISSWIWLPALALGVWYTVWRLRLR